MIVKRRLMRFTVVLITCLASSEVASLAAQEPSSPLRTPATGITAFVDVAVIPMDSTQMMSHQTVIVGGDRILAIGPAAAVKVPADAQRIDGQGKFLLPGLGDMHFHTSLTDSALAEKGMLVGLAHGVTTARIMSGVSFHLAFRARAARGELLSPRVYTAGPTVGQSDAQLHTGADAVGIVAEQQAAGYDFIKLYSGDYPSEALDSLRAAAARTKFRISGHVPTSDSVGLEWALTVPYRSMEHLYGYLSYLGVSDQDTLPLDEAHLHRIATKTQRSGVWNTPTLLALTHIGTSKPKVLSNYQILVKALQDAGAGLLLGTDVTWGERCYRDGQPGSPVRRELQALVRAGLTPYQALVTGTRNVAAFFEALDRVGTIAVGKRADLVLVESNPLSPADDFAALESPAGVMVGGRWLSRATLDTAMAAAGICAATP